MIQYIELGSDMSLKDKYTNVFDTFTKKAKVLGFKVKTNGNNVSNIYFKAPETVQTDPIYLSVDANKGTFNFGIKSQSSGQTVPILKQNRWLNIIGLRQAFDTVIDDYCSETLTDSQETKLKYEYNNLLYAIEKEYLGKR